MAGPSHGVTLLLCGDVMTGRGIDQILSRPSAPGIHERWAQSALDYVALAERANGPIPRSVAPDYIWGDALGELESSDLRIINLETSVTTSENWEPKGINYRMHPSNVACLTAAGVDCCVLANNHVLDWGSTGLEETLDTLRRSGLATVGAGRFLGEAMAPAVFEIPDRGRVLVWACGTGSSGIPRHWAAGSQRPGVARLADLSAATVREWSTVIRRTRQPGDLAVLSIHWGDNWGYEIPPPQRQFAHTLIDEGEVDVVHGHSSHHPMGIEIYRGKLILHGCGDFLNDYEGIRGHEEYRSELVVAYRAAFDPAARRLLAVELIPFRIRRFRLQRATREEVSWLERTLDRECRRLGAGVGATADGELALRWG